MNFLFSWWSVWSHQLFTLTNPYRLHLDLRIFDIVYFSHDELLDTYEDFSRSEIRFVFFTLATYRYIPTM